MYILCSTEDTSWAAQNPEAFSFITLKGGAVTQMRSVVIPGTKELDFEIGFYCKFCL